MGNFINKTIVITGAGRGIGRALAQYLAANGAAVVVNDLEPTLLESLVEEIKNSGGSAFALSGSVSDWDFAKKLIDSAQQQFGSLDGLVNNAGLHYSAALQDENPEQIKKMVDVNVIGTMYCGLHALNVFTKQRTGALVNVSSAAHLGVQRQSIYAATKGAIASLTYSWALDAMPYGVRVNAVSPLAKTRMTDSLPQYNDNGQALPKVQPASSLAPLFGFLLSDAASTITGQLLRFDGQRLSLIEHPKLASQDVMRDDWDINTLQTAFDESLSKQLKPFGLGSVNYQWQPDE